MKTLIQFLLATFTILACVCCKTAKEEKTDDKLNEITFADPTIFVENGKYYLTGTRNREPNGFAIFESTDLKEWKTANGDTLQLILRKGDSAYGERGFWAPQLFKEGNRYYLTYTAMNILHWHPPTLYMVHSDKTPYVLLTRRPKISIHFYSKIQMESTTCIMYVSTKEIICG